MNQINTLAEMLDSPGLYVTNSFIVAGYTNPAAAHRVNEIWYIQRQGRVSHGSPCTCWFAPICSLNKHIVLSEIIR